MLRTPTHINYFYLCSNIPGCMCVCMYVSRVERIFLDWLKIISFRRNSPKYFRYVWNSKNLDQSPFSFAQNTFYYFWREKNSEIHKCCNSIFTRDACIYVSVYKSPHSLWRNKSIKLTFEHQSTKRLRANILNANAHNNRPYTFRCYCCVSPSFALLRYVDALMFKVVQESIGEKSGKMNLVWKKSWRIKYHIFAWWCR